MTGVPTPAEQRRRVALMKQALAAARLARDDAWRAVAETERRLGVAREELATIERRRELARAIGDDETVAVAERFAAPQRETIALLERKAAVQRDEAALAERTAREMEGELEAATGRRAAPPPDAPGVAADDAAPPPPASGVDEASFDRFEHERRAREAADRLAALKRRMGRG